MFLVIQKWHKKIGIFIALFVIFLSISGIALNHSEKLRLNTTFIQMEWLLDLYQISPPSELISFPTHNNNWASQLGKRIYFNDKEIINDANKLVGVIYVNNTFVVGYDGKLMVLTNKGELLESLSGVEGVPAGMKKIGYDEVNNVIIESAHGYYRVNLEILAWDEHDYLSADWSTVSNISEHLKKAIFNEYRGRGLTIEKVLLDMHSGRVVGTWGVYFMDLVAILFLIISFTGVWMWWQRKD
ncbi:MAG: PepSY domain-containing protein [Gammaproteobacteria bacterium]